MSSTLNINEIKYALIFGSNGGIGHGLATKLLSINSDVKVVLHHRHDHAPKNLQDLKVKYGERVSLISSELNQNEIEKVATELKQKNIVLDLLVNTIGFLHDEILGPEKSLRDINEEHFAKSFFINSTLTALIAKSFIPLFDRKKPSAFVAISAKVGSISDNGMGGWYSYRASKAALNMILKNISIELDRKKSLTKVLSIHPGTTDTGLSKPFTKNTPYKLHTPLESAKNILDVIFSNETENGGFYSWDGSQITW